MLWAPSRRTITAQAVEPHPSASISLNSLSIYTVVKKKFTFANISEIGLHKSVGPRYSSLRNSIGNLSAQYSDTYRPPWPSKIANKPHEESFPTLSTMQCAKCEKYFLTVFHLGPKFHILVFLISIFSHATSICIVLTRFFNLNLSWGISPNWASSKLDLRRLLIRTRAPINYILLRKSSMGWFVSISWLVWALHFII